MAANINLSDHAKRVTSFFEEFKAFALKGNVVDLAVGVVIGAAFGAIVKSLVDNVFMPLIGMIMPGDKGYEAWQIGQIKFGLFIGSVSTSSSSPSSSMCSSSSFSAGSYGP